MKIPVPSNRKYIELVRNLPEIDSHVTITVQLSRNELVLSGFTYSKTGVN